MLCVGNWGSGYLLDNETIKVVRRLIMAFLVNEQWAGYLTKGDVFSFLDGFEKENN